MILQSLLLGLYSEKTLNSKRCMHPSVHSQAMEANNISINRSMDKENVIDTCTRILLSYKKNEISYLQQH